MPKMLFGGPGCKCRPGSQVETHAVSDDSTGPGLVQNLARRCESEGAQVHIVNLSGAVSAGYAEVATTAPVIMNGESLERGQDLAPNDGTLPRFGRSLSRTIQVYTRKEAIFFSDLETVKRRKKWPAAATYRVSNVVIPCSMRVSMRLGPHSTVLVHVLDPATIVQNVHGWQLDLDDQIGGLVEHSHAFEPKQIRRAPAPILERQSFAIDLIVYNQGDCLELAPTRVQVESEDAERAGEREPGGSLTWPVIDPDNLQFAPVTGDFGHKRPVRRSAGDQ
jgi:hypothetical protein